MCCATEGSGKVPRGPRTGGKDPLFERFYLASKWANHGGKKIETKKRSETFTKPESNAGLPIPQKASSVYSSSEHLDPTGMGTVLTQGVSHSAIRYLLDLIPPGIRYSVLIVDKEYTTKLKVGYLLRNYHRSFQTDTYQLKMAISKLYKQDNTPSRAKHTNLNMCSRRLCVSIYYSLSILKALSYKAEMRLLPRTVHMQQKRTSRKSNRGDYSRSTASYKVATREILRGSSTSEMVRTLSSQRRTRVLRVMCYVRESYNSSRFIYRIMCHIKVHFYKGRTKLFNKRMSSS